jgi:alpha-galactosidase
MQEAGVAILRDEHGYILETARTAYAFGRTSCGQLAHRYWGARLNGPVDYPPAVDGSGWASFNNPGQQTLFEYPAYAGMVFIEPCLKLTYADGVRDTVLRYVRDEQPADEELTIVLRDVDYPLEVALHYRVHVTADIIERRVTVRNLGTAVITLERIWSALWHLPQHRSYRLSHLTGRHMDEFNLRRDRLTHGVKRLESRRITTSHHHNPWFALDHGTADETQGSVWFGALQWSGNWVIAAEVTDFGSTRIGIGLNDWDFAWQLAGGAEFSTPAALSGFTAEGFGEASRLMHRYARSLLPHGRFLHPVMYNSWEATEFAVDVESQAQLAELAAEMGIELFVMDDGWFHGRNHDRAGLGDWWPDEVKFPQGLQPLISRVEELGMQFGLWVEPEMVNPDSELYRAHPDWVIHFPTRARTEGRNQLILNLGRPDVQQYLLDRLDTLLANHAISFIKWDMNRNVSEPGWPDAAGDQRELWVRYVEGVYRLWGELRRRHPQVVFQSCSGGGGRADLGILRYADQIWVSDNTEPTKRLLIQEGFSQYLPPDAMEAWVTDMGPAYLPLSFRSHVSMAGVLAIGGHLAHWSAEKRAEAARHIAHYKQIRPLVQHGNLYRLRSAHESAYSAVMYLDEAAEAGVLFVYRTHLPSYSDLPPIALQGLLPDAWYEVEGIDGIRSGRSWMHVGLRIALQDYQSTVRLIRRVAQP